MAVKKKTRKKDRRFEDGLYFFGPKETPHDTAPTRRTEKYAAGTGYKATASGMSEFEFCNYLRRLFKAAHSKKRQYLERWYRNYRLIQNFPGNPSPNSWAPFPRDSEVFPTISALVAWMTDQNTIIDCFPASDPHSSFYDFISHIANDLSAVLYSLWLAEDYNAQIKLVLWDAFSYGTGIFKTAWDSSLDNGFGNAMLKRVDPYSFFPDPNGTSMEDCEYFVEVRKMSFDELERRFPNSSALMEIGTGSADPDAEVDQKPTLAANVSRPDPPNLGALPSGNGAWSMPRRRSRERVGQIPMVTVYEFWLKDNDFEEEDYSDLDEDERPALAEAHCKVRWRAVVMANGHILLDEYADDLFTHGQHPYERYCFDDIGEFYGISLVDHLAYPQIYINRLLTAAQSNAELTGNPVFLDPSNSGLSRVGIVNRPGQRLQVNPQALANGKGPSWLTPPSMPQQVMDLVNFWISRIENTSGLSAIVKGATPSQRNSQGVMSSIQEAAFVRIRSGLRNLEKALEKCATKIADIIVDNYTEQRVMAIVGPEGEQTSMVLQARHFYGPTEHGASPMKFMIQIKSGASAPTSRQARTAEADTLFGMGALDRRGVLEAHQYPHIDEIIKRINEGIKDGTFNPPGARQRSQRKS